MFNNILLQATQNDLLFVSDKIYAVLTVILLIFGATIGYLFFTQKKVDALEEKVNNLTKK